MFNQSIYTASLNLKDDVGSYRRLLEGVIDIQIHLAPDVTRRSADDLEFAGFAKRVGYKGFVIKNHHAISADRAYLIRNSVKGIEAFGGITLNHSVGGLNPAAVEAAIQFGAVEVWMPTFSAQNHLKYFPTANLPSLERVRKLNFQPSTPPWISILDDAEKLRPEVNDILSLVSEADIILGTGHVSLKETYTLVEAAGKVKVRKIIVTHPEFKATNWSGEDQGRLADMGAVMEHCATAGYDANLISKNIKHVGADRCLLSSDSGQISKGHPVDAMKNFITDLMAMGMSESEIWKMTRENPAKLLGLD